MLEMFEKLINEHGSATILKERIELINDKYEALQTKLQNVEKENELLKRENELLTNQINEYKEKSATIESQSESIPEPQKEILKILFSTDSGVNEKVLLRQLNLDIGTLQYHTDALLDKKLISHPGYTMANSFTGEPGSCEHYISKNGRKYVVEIIGT